MDPLSISQGEGHGLAQVLPSSGKSPYDLYTDYIKAKGVRDQAVQKEKQSVYKGLEDIKLSGFVNHTKQLGEQKQRLLDRLTSQYTTQGKKYNHSADADLVKGVNTLKENIVFSNNIKELFNEFYKDYHANKEGWDPKSVEQAQAFYNLPTIEEQREYIEKNGVPMLQRKEEVINYIDEINKLDTPYKENAGETPGKDGRIGTYDTTVVDEIKLGDQADRFWIAGENNASKGAQKLMEVVSEKINSDPNTILLSEEEKAQKVKQAFKDEFIKIKLSQAKESKKYGSKSAGEGGGELGSNTVKNGGWSFTYNPNTAEIDIANVKSEMENKPYAFAITEDGGKQKTVSAIPISWDYKNAAPGQPNLIVMDVSGTTKKKRVIPHKIAVSKMANITGSDVGDIQKQLNEKGAFGGQKKAVTTGGESTEKSKYVKGHEQGGYRFKGGDPANQSNWEKIK